MVVWQWIIEEICGIGVGLECSGVRCWSLTAYGPAISHKVPATDVADMSMCNMGRYHGVQEIVMCVWMTRGQPALHDQARQQTACHVTVLLEHSP